MSSLPACVTEDSINCFWDATAHGNGVGRSFENINGVVTYVDSGYVPNVPSPTPLPPVPYDINVLPATGASFDWQGFLFFGSFILIAGVLLVMYMLLAKYIGPMTGLLWLIFGVVSIIISAVFSLSFIWAFVTGLVFGGTGYFLGHLIDERKGNLRVRR